MTYDCAIFLIGVPEYTFEAALSAVLRVYEVFKPEKIVLSYSKFARDVALRVKNIAGKVTDCQIETHELPHTAISFKPPEALLQGILNGVGCKRDDVLLVPTAGSIGSIINLVYAAAKEGGIDIAHVLFPFGYWSGLYYPFVPRYFQPIMLLTQDSRGSSNVHFDNDLIRHFKEAFLKSGGEGKDLLNLDKMPDLRKSIAELAFRINEVYENPCIGESQTPVLCLQIEVEDQSHYSVRLLLSTSSGRHEIDGFTVSLRDRRFRYGDRHGDTLRKVMEDMLESLQGGKKVKDEDLVNALCKALNCEGLLRRNGVKYESVICTTNITIECLKAWTAFACTLLSCGSVKLKSIKDVFDNEELLAISGFYELILHDIDGRSYELHDVFTAYKGVVIDTSVVYRGIHNYVFTSAYFTRGVSMPYCVYNEIYAKVTERKGLMDVIKARAAWRAYDVLRHYCRLIPSEAHICDIAIPRIDVDLIEDHAVLTADDAAFAAWSKTRFNKYRYARPFLVKLKPIAGDASRHTAFEPGLHYAILQLYALIKDVTAYLGLLTS